MIDEDQPIPRTGGAEPEGCAERERDGADTRAMHARMALAPSQGLACSDPLYAAGAVYDPYNTGAFRVLAQRPRRRTLDDMRRLDAEIRRSK